MEYKFPEDSVKAWELLLARMYPPNEPIPTTNLLEVVKLIDKYNIQWLIPEIGKACENVPANERKNFISVLFDLGMHHVIDAWLEDFEFQLSLRADDNWVDQLVTLGVNQYMLRKIL